MSRLPADYREQDGCWNCEHVQDCGYEGFEGYCYADSEPSASARERYKQIYGEDFWKENPKRLWRHLPRYNALEHEAHAWYTDHAVEPYGKCSRHVLRKAEEQP